MHIILYMYIHMVYICIYIYTYSGQLKFAGRFVYCFIFGLVWDNDPRHLTGFFGVRVGKKNWLYKFLVRSMWVHISSWATDPPQMRFLAYHPRKTLASGPWLSLLPSWICQSERKTRQGWEKLFKHEPLQTTLTLMSVWR